MKYEMFNLSEIHFMVNYLMLEMYRKNEVDYNLNINVYVLN